MPFIDGVHLHQAVTSRAVPLLEAIAANDNLRSLRRFEREDPPPYESSTESEDFDVPEPGPMPQDFEALMDRPISEEELQRMSLRMSKIIYPREVYRNEAHSESNRLEHHIRGPRPIVFQRLNGNRRHGVLVRHFVKRRWERLGIWSPEWGFAGRKVKPGDDYSRWTWWWQAAGDQECVEQYARELIARVLRLRQNLRRGEHAPVSPQSRLGPGTTAAEAEAFLISRPWFIYRIEVAEENTRHDRLSLDDQFRYPHSAHDVVRERWKERGDWRDEFDEHTRVTAWKWRHESPSPEPEDLAPIDKINNTCSPLDVAAEMELTSSEIDELETIDLPESEQPKGFWVIEEGEWGPFLPGQMADELARVAKRVKENNKWLEKERAEGREPPVDLHYKDLSDEFFGGNEIPLFGPPAANLEATQSGDVVEKLQQDAPKPREDAAYPPPSKRRRSQGRSPRVVTDSAPDQDQPVPLRRSARIAGIKRAAEAQESQKMPNKRLRAEAAPLAAASTAAANSEEVPRIKTRSKQAHPPSTRGPGRPKKENGPAKGSASKGKTQRGPAPVKTKKDEAVEADRTRSKQAHTPSKRRPGRPRKENRPAKGSASKGKTQRAPAPVRTEKDKAVGADGTGVTKRRGRPRKSR